MRWLVVIGVACSAGRAGADGKLAFTAGLGHSWVDFVPAQSQTLDGGQSGFVELGWPVYADVGRDLAVEVGGRLSLEHLEGQQYPGTIPYTYLYMPYALGAQGTVMYARRAWLSLGASYYRGYYRSSPTFDEVQTHTEGSGLALGTTLGCVVYSGFGVYAAVTHFAGEGDTYAVGIAFKIGGK